MFRYTDMNLSRFEKVDYPQFRKTLSHSSGNKVKNQGKSTLLYGRNNTVVAVMQAATIDNKGYTHPPCYFIKPNETIAA